MLRNPERGDDPPPEMFTDGPGESVRKPGPYPGLTRGEYEAIQALNFSVLGLFAPPSTPAHARHRWLHPPDASAAQNLGAKVHVAVLEPERFRTAYIPAPKVDRRTTEGKAIWAELESRLTPGAGLMPEAEWKQVEAMREAVYAHPLASEMLSGPGANELSIVWDLKGTLCKARLDRLGSFAGYPFVVELKTCASADDRSFCRAIADYGYHRQLAWYLSGLEELQPAMRRAAVIAVENTPPYCVRVFEMDSRAIEQGQRENEKMLARFLECARESQWPGYPPELYPIDLPAWAVDRLE